MFWVNKSLSLNYSFTVQPQKGDVLWNGDGGEMDSAKPLFFLALHMKFTSDVWSSPLKDLQTCIWARPQDFHTFSRKTFFLALPKVKTAIEWFRAAIARRLWCQAKAISFDLCWNLQRRNVSEGSICSQGLSIPLQRRGAMGKSRELMMEEMMMMTRMMMMTKARVMMMHCIYRGIAVFCFWFILYQNKQGLGSLCLRDAGVVTVIMRIRRTCCTVDC